MSEMASSSSSRQQASEREVGAESGGDDTSVNDLTDAFVVSAWKEDEMVGDRGLPFDGRGHVLVGCDG
jgi:hypothetical protein